MKTAVKIKNREKLKESESNKNKSDPKPDHELFIQAYEKPTQIYKFLRTRFKHSPYFLYRNLSYMMKKSRKCRPKSKPESQPKSSQEKGEVVRKLADKLVAQCTGAVLGTNHQFLHIQYLGLLTKDGNTEPVEVETLVMMLCNKKRKENTCSVQTKRIGSCKIPGNPPDDLVPVDTEVTISTDSLGLSNGFWVKSYHLLMKVSTPTSNGLTNRDNELNGPNSKKRKLSSGRDEKSYVANLTMYDKRNKCFLPEGEYQLLMHEWTQNSTSRVSHVNTSWETIPHMDENERSRAFESFTAGPNLKLRLSWSSDGESDFPLLVSAKNGEANDEEMSSNCSNSSSNKENNNPDTNGVVSLTQLTQNFQIVYQFLYSNNSRQQTEPHRDFHCPWCPKLDCVTLYSLLKHLKLCHARFTFCYTEILNGARIDVALNEKYDGSYIGPSRELTLGSKTYGMSRRGPVCRAPVSKILVCHPKRPRRFSLQEFLNEKDENDGVDISGHNRLYHHTSTCLPIYPKEMDVDSENESDPKWLQKKTTMMIDDFTDVNDGEKELMKMWNLHIMKYGFVGDCQIPLACTLFLETRGQELLQKNLYRNFVLHMCNLFDFGLISAVTVYTTIQRLQELIGEGTQVSTILRESWTVQRANWLKMNHAPPCNSIGGVKKEEK